MKETKFYDIMTIDLLTLLYDGVRIWPILIANMHLFSDGQFILSGY
ncbi:hypothetical protein PG301_26740 [Parageobacillus sp. G301]|jgi:hypothetical protein|nr:hypothetical protein PG301_26740 [Parageobacillus sp. G301]